MALVSSAISRAFLPLPASLGRPTWPSPCPFLDRKHHRDAEPAVLKEKFLDGVGQFGHFARIFAFARVAGAADLAESVPLFEGGFGLLEVEVADRKSTRL